MNHPKVSIIIPCRNEEKYIAQNIDSILSQNYLGEIELIIVDGMSDDNTREVINQYPNNSVKLIDNIEKVTPKALNLGIDNCTGEIFIILGGHAFLDKNFVKNNVDLLLKDKSLGCAGGIIKNIYENETGEIVSKAMASVFGVGNATFRTGGKAQYLDTVAFGAYWKKIHYEIGGFNEELVRNQDDEYNYKVVKAGYKIFFDPNIISFYYVRGSLKKLYNQYLQYGYWKVYVNKLHKTVTSVRQLIPLFFVIGIILGGIVTCFFPFFWQIYFGGIILYLLLAIFFGIKSTGKLFPGLRVALVFPILHWSYGLGYLKGIIHFLIFGKKPSEKSKKLTRK